MRINCSSDREKLWNFEAEGREFDKNNFSGVQNNFGNKILFLPSDFKEIIGPDQPIF